MTNDKGNLVFSRKGGESIIIGNRQITIKVLEIIGTQVKLAIEAPKNLSVHRAEIFEKIESGDENGNRIISDIPITE